MCFWNFLLPDLKWPPARLLRSPSSMRTIQGRLWRKFRLDFWNIFFLYLLTGQAGLILPPKGSLSMADLLRFCLNYKKNKCEIGEWLQIGERNKEEKKTCWCQQYGIRSHLVKLQKLAIFSSNSISQSHRKGAVCGQWRNLPTAERSKKYVFF